MKKFNLLLLCSFLLFSLQAQVGPIDYEEAGNGADWTWTVFENDTNPALEIVDNPDPTGANTSSTVAKFTALQTGNPWAGCESLHGADIGPFTIESSNNKIRIMVWKSVISDVGIKLVTSSGWSKGELKVANTKIDEWEQLTFDFSTVDHENMTYDQIVVFPDFNARDADNIIYFDNISFTDVPTSTINLATNNLKLFPNPSHETIQIEAEENITDIKVYDQLGKLVMHKLPATNSMSLNIAHLPHGLYTALVNVGDELLSKKFMKVK